METESGLLKWSKHTRFKKVYHTLKFLKNKKHLLWLKIKYSNNSKPMGSHLWLNQLLGPKQFMRKWTMNNIQYFLKVIKALFHFITTWSLSVLITL